MDSNMAPSPTSAKPGAETALSGRRSRAPHGLGRDAGPAAKPNVRGGPVRESLARRRVAARATATFVHGAKHSGFAGVAHAAARDAPVAPRIVVCRVGPPRRTCLSWPERRGQG